jgi:hypothetical protein
VSTVRPIQALFLLAACALAVCAQASYGQMRLDGIAFILAFLLVVAYGVIVDLLLLAGFFRYRAALVVGFALALAVIALLLGAGASPSERTGFFKGAPGGAALVVLVLTSAVFLPFIVIAPIAQYRWMREERRWPRWMTAWMVLQVALLPGFFVLATADDRFWERDHAAARAIGREARAGELGAMLERAELQRERIWGTGWTYPWKLETPPGSYPRHSGWMSGLAKGIDASAAIAANEPLSESDRKVLRTLIARHFVGYAIPYIETKLIWDALEPGRFSRQLAPAGVKETARISEEALPVLLERLEKHGEARLCPDGRMTDADRAVLRELVLAKVRTYAEAREREAVAEAEDRKREQEMSDAPVPYRLMWKAAGALRDAYGGQPSKPPDWEAYARQLERICRRPE